MFLVMVFLHLAFIITAIAMSYGSQLMLLVAIRSDRVENVRGITSTTLRLGGVVPILFVVAGVFGLAAAWVGGFPLLAPWLVISYVCFAILAISGVTLTGSNYTRLRASIAGAGDGPLPPDTRQLVSSNAFRGGVALDFTLLAVLVIDMVFKPLS